ncbi:MAG: lipoprotein signal peptidase [Flavobacteriaceae bacterium]|nr:lipoprotein signal peptidase [Flavobacteriaceae bacterium]
MNFPLLNNNRLIHGFIIVIIIILIDQSTKFYIKLNYPLTIFFDQAILDWGFFKILFVENKGMAMGAKLNDIIPFLTEKSAKLFLTVFRLIAILFIGFWMRNIYINKSSIYLRWSLCLILAGAIGNIIDSVFYGVIFDHSYQQISTFLPSKGYAPIFYGNVVDMIQFPLIEWTWPGWMPFIGGKNYLFFQYIFNIADSAISIGVAILIFFNKNIFSKNQK